MNANSSLAEPAAPRVCFISFYYGWVCVAVAAAAMSATLPGRTHGLSLITTHLLADLGMKETTYGWINWACTLLGAAICLPVGLAIDRQGVRRVLAATSVILGLSVVAMSSVKTPAGLFLTLLLVRGFGQGALSVVNLAIVGKWFRRRLEIAMGLYSVLVTLGFIAGTLGLEYAVSVSHWRTAWGELGWLLVAFAPLAWLLTRDSPEACGLKPDEPARETDAILEGGDFTVWEALATPAFWVFGAGTAAFNLVWSSITLFNESLLAEHGFDRAAAVQLLTILCGTGLLANFLAGALAKRERLGMLMGLGLSVLAVSLFCFPAIRSLGALQLYAVFLGFSGGIITVVFFAAWGHLFGRKELGRIQGVAQVITILASAFGPAWLAEWRERMGSSNGMFLLLAAAVGMAALAAFVVRPPRRIEVTAPLGVDAVQG